MSQNGQPLSGVTISVHNHPEFGHSKSRIDGLFDLVVNGGSVLTINYEKASYFSSQRLANVPWQDCTWLPDVVMVQPDPNVSTITLNNNTQMQIARGSISNDNSGERQVTLLFPPGIQVTNFNTESINVRATEYTVGQYGPKAMPAELPSGFGYTYCVELGVDGAEDVQFSAPVFLYVENFLNFPTGGIVPAAYYDRSLSDCNSTSGTGWIPSTNGRIISILSIQNGNALIDIDGSGNAASETDLAQLGVSDEELGTLATLYSVGKSLWRVPISHFSTWDCNWGIFPPEDAEKPEEEVEADVVDPDPCTIDGSIIELQNQVLREKIDITGTPFSLNYSSKGVPGRKASNTIKIALTDNTMPASLQDLMNVFIWMI